MVGTAPPRLLHPPFGLPGVLFPFAAPPVEYRPPPRCICMFGRATKPHKHWQGAHMQGMCCVCACSSATHACVEKRRSASLDMRKLSTLEMRAGSCKRARGCLASPPLALSPWGSKALRPWFLEPARIASARRRCTRCPLPDWRSCQGCCVVTSDPRT